MVQPTYEPTVNRKTKIASQFGHHAKNAAGRAMIRMNMETASALWDGDDFDARNKN